ncbi:MAG: argininosuccinate synthase [Deltaproteobacteria bacterium]|nr:argininosuccinate synthase [Deltaproteobacteria bacterium]
MNDINKEKVILAYSGGLDTSVILQWLLERNYDVVAYIANVGQDDDFDAAKAKALKIGASKVYIEDLREELVTDYVFQMFKANAIYESRYLQGTAIARPIIAKRHIEIAQKEGAQYVSHGATGKGNDQVRFELGYYALMPDVKIIAPWKMQEFLDQFKGRTDLINYAQANGIEIAQTTKKPYSEDDNLLHISHEAGVLEDPWYRPEKDVFSKTLDPMDAPDEATIINITFNKGVPVKVENENDGTVVEKPLELFIYLNKLGHDNGIGRIDIVENRFVGLKSRGIYETPGGTILLNAHMDLEGITIDREVLRIRDMIKQKYADTIYNGFWFSPEMEFLNAIVDKSQETVNGTVSLRLYKGNAYATGRKSDNSLYDEDLSSMDIEGGYDQKDAQGFIRINAVRLRTWAKKQSDR